jgi:ribosome recycling factor
MLNEILEHHEERMKSTVHVYEEDLHGIRGNRASISLVDRLMVDYYGQQTEMRKLANISTPEPMTITIRAYDPGAVHFIETAINKANLGLNPNVDSGVIRLNMPALTRERRQDLVKLLHKRAEQARVGVRNVRRDAIADVKELEKEHEISEDDSKRGQEKVEDMTKRFVEHIDELTRVKEKDIMEV